MKDNKDLKKLERRICCVDGQVEDLAALVDQLAEDLAELIESGAGASFEQVTNYAALPAAGAHTGEYFHVLNSQGTSWLPGSLGGTYYSKGFYYSTGTDWVFVGEVPYQASQATVDAGTDNTQFVTASTLAGASKWSTKQDNITLTTSGTSGAATLAAGALNIPQYQAALTNPVTGTGASGQVTFWTGTNTQSGDNALYWDNVNKRLGVGTASPSSPLTAAGVIHIVQSNAGATSGIRRQVFPGTTSPYVHFIWDSVDIGGDNGLVLRVDAYWNNVGIGGINPTSSIRTHIRGRGTTSATEGLRVENSAASAKLAVKDNGSIEIGKNDSGTTQSTASITVISGDANTGLALVPKGFGAITAQIPNGAASGGNSRGNNAVDWQIVRASAAHVANGTSSVICGGSNNTSSNSGAFVGGGNYNISSGDRSAVVGGEGNKATAIFSFVGGGNNNTASGVRSSILGGGMDPGGAQTASGEGSAICGGLGNTASAAYSATVGGVRAVSYLASQVATASGTFSGTSTGDAQTSNIRYRNAITGTAKTELFLDGTSVRAILALPTGATNGRLWNAKVQIAAICTTQGNGTVTAGESFIGNYAVGISRIGTTTSLIGTVQNLHTPQTSTNMADAVVDITADDTNEALKIEFTPPTTAGSTTVIRVVATVYLTEVGY